MASLSLIFALCVLSGTVSAQTSGRNNCTFVNNPGSTNGFDCTEYDVCDTDYRSDTWGASLDRPYNMSVEGFQSHNVGEISPKVTITWMMPRHGNLYLLQGFEIVVIPVSKRSGGILDGTRTCHLLSVTNVRTLLALYHTIFQLDVTFDAFPENDSVTYFTQIYSLPKPPLEHDRNTSVAYKYFIQNRRNGHFHFSTTN